MSEHAWFERKFRSFVNPIVCCKSCGIVKRRNGENKPCPGKVRVELRENRIKEPAPSPPPAKEPG